MKYTAKAGEILDEQGRQVAVILRTSCTAKELALMAKAAAEAMNRKEAP